MQSPHPIDRRDVLKASGLFAATAALSPAALFQDPAAPAGRAELLLGLDGLSRAGDDGFDAFADGHGAAAVLAAAFFGREHDLDAATRQAMRELLDTRVLTSPLYAPRAEERADEALVAGLVTELDRGADSLRFSGHNLVFAAAALKALRALPEAATPARVDGLRRMVRSFGTGKVPGKRVDDAASFVDPADDAKFVRFLFAEYLRALDLYLDGKGHHGFAGHVLTVGHALIELCRLGHAATAQKAAPAFRQFVQRARNGDDVGGRKVKAPPAQFPGPLERAYWAQQLERPAGILITSHLVKYHYSFQALIRDLADAELKQRVLAKLWYLTATS